MKTRILSFVIPVIAILMLISTSGCGFERIDAGFEGIQVNKYGDEKGVDQVVQVTGAV